MESIEMPNTADFAFKIFLKDNKAKIIISNIIIHGILDFMNYQWTKDAIEITQKQLASEDLEEIVKGKTEETGYRSLVKEIMTIINSYQSALQKKAESDF
jgi:ribosomal protein S7